MKTAHDTENDTDNLRYDQYERENDNANANDNDNDNDILGSRIVPTRWQSLSSFLVFAVLAVVIVVVIDLAVGIAMIMLIVIAFVVEGRPGGRCRHSRHHLRRDLQRDVRKEQQARCLHGNQEPCQQRPAPPRIPLVGSSVVAKSASLLFLQNIPASARVVAGVLARAT